MAKAAKPKKKIKRTDKAQSERFKKIARELGADKSLEDFDQDFRNIVPPKRVEKTSQ